MVRTAVPDANGGNTGTGGEGPNGGTGPKTEVIQEPAVRVQTVVMDQTEAIRELAAKVLPVAPVQTESVGPTAAMAHQEVTALVETVPAAVQQDLVMELQEIPLVVDQLEKMPSRKTVKKHLWNMPKL